MALATTQAHVAPAIAPGDDPSSPELVGAFFERNPGLRPLADELARLARAAFPGDAPPTFEVLLEPEEDDEPRSLFVMVATTLDYTIARPRLNGLLRTTFDDVLKRSGERLGINLIYV